MKCEPGLTYRRTRSDELHFARQAGGKAVGEGPAGEYLCRRPLGVG